MSSLAAVVVASILAAPVPIAHRNGTTASDPSACAYLEQYLDPQACTCSDVNLGAVAQCSVNVLGLDTVGVKAQFEPCANPLSIGLEVTEADAGIDYPIAGITAGDDKEIPIPGLAWGIPIVGNAAANMAVKVDGNLDAVTIAIGVDACATVLGITKCGSDLTSELPVYILNDEFDFSNLCNAMKAKVKMQTKAIKAPEVVADEPGCCGDPCQEATDCAAGLFCCPHHFECMDTTTKSTAGPNCDQCKPPVTMAITEKAAPKECK